MTMQTDNANIQRLLNQVELSNTLRRLWIEHVMWTRAFIISTAFDLNDLKAVTDRLLLNPADFANVLRIFYGDRDAKKFEELFSQHLLIAAQLVNAVKTDDPAAEELHKKWYANADEIADFMAGINRYWDKAELQAMLYDHLSLTEHEAMQILSGQYAQSIAQYDAIQDQALKMADDMTYGIFRQFQI